MLPDHEEVADRIVVKYGKSPRRIHRIARIELEQLSGRKRFDPSFIDAVRISVNRRSGFYMTPCEGGVFSLIPLEGAPTTNTAQARRGSGNVQINGNVYITIRYG